MRLPAVLFAATALFVASPALLRAQESAAPSAAATLRVEPDPLRLPEVRYGMPAVAHGDSLYVFGGSGRGGYKGDVIRVTPSSGKVVTVATGLVGRRYHTAEAWGRYIYVMGGTTEADGNTDVVERFDTRTGKVERMAPLPVPVQMTCSVVHQGRVYVIGGTDSAGKFTGATQVYDITRNEWTQAAPMPTPRFTDAVVHAGRIWAIGGWNGDKGLTTVESFSLASGAWERQPELAFAQSAHHMAVVGGKIYSFGDFDRPERVGVYDPKARAIAGFENTGFVTCRNNAVAALNGVVYVIGGNKTAEGLSVDLVQAFPVVAGPRRQATR